MHPLLSRFAPLTILAAAGLAAAGWTSFNTVKPRAVPPVKELPSQGPWAERISSSGLIEGDGNDTAVGIPETGLVAEVAVRIGQRVAAGDLLFRLDDRTIRSELAVAEAELAIALASATAAQAEIIRMESLPRAEDAGPATAQLGVADAQLALFRTRRERLERLGERGVESELADARLAEAVAVAQVASAKAALAHARLGVWSQDLAVAQQRLAIAAAQVVSAQARVAGMRTRLERLAVCAPRTATVIATTVMVGALAAPGERDLVVLANLERLLVRVEVNESQVWKLKPGLPGQAWLRGDRTRPVELRFERIEPLAAARRAIPGKPGERLDGRAVQVLYQLINPPTYLRPGLLMDVDLQSGSASATTAAQAKS